MLINGLLHEVRPRSSVLSSHLYIFCVMNKFRWLGTFPLIRVCTVLVLQSLSYWSELILAMCFMSTKLFLFVSYKRQNQLALCFYVTPTWYLWHIHVVIHRCCNTLGMTCCSPDGITLFFVTSHLISYVAYVVCQPHLYWAPFFCHQSAYIWKLLGSEGRSTPRLSSGISSIY